MTSAMALQLGALRDALDAAGVDRDLARRAAEEVAAYEQRFITVEAKIEAFERRTEVRFATLEGKIDKLFWAVTPIGALSLLTLGKIWFG